VAEMNALIKGFMDHSENISMLVTSILLVIVYIFGIGLTSFFFRLFGKEALKTKKKGGSYYEDLSMKKKDHGDHLKQY
jgi:hypothetical protein